MVLEMERPTENIIKRTIDADQSPNGHVVNASVPEDQEEVIVDYRYSGFVVPRGLEVPQVNGVVGGRQTGVWRNTQIMHLEHLLAENRKSWKQRLIDRTDFISRRRTFREELSIVR